MRIFLFLILSGLAARADTLSDLKAALIRLTAQDPVKAKVELQISSRNGDADKPAEQGAATAQAEAGPDGLRILFSRDEIRAAAQELQSKNTDPPSPVRRALGALSAARVQDYLDGAPALLRLLDGAELTGEKADTWQGRPARLLSLKLNPRMSERDRKRIKELDAAAQIWVGRDGVPLAAESHVMTRGRALLVISFESSTTEEFRFARVGDRLVVIRHVRENSGSAGGENGSQKTVAILTVE